MTDAIHGREHHAIQETAGALRRHAAACHPIPNRRPGVGRPYRLGPRQARTGDLMAFGCLVLALLMAVDWWRSAQSIVTPYVIEVDNATRCAPVGEAATPLPAHRCQTAHHIGALRDAGSLAVRRSHRRPPELAGRHYDHTTDKGAAVLNDSQKRVNDPFARIGKSR